MAKDLVPVIDSKRNFSKRRRTWVEKHEAAQTGSWQAGIFVFFTDEEIAARRVRAAEPTPRSNGASEHGRTTVPIVLRPNDLTPDTSSAPWVSYPMPRRGGGIRGLRAEYAPIARAGAGLR